MGFSPGPNRWLKKPDEYNLWGYYECLPLLYIENDILRSLGGDCNNIPEFPANWSSLFKKKKAKINSIIRNGGIEIYKGNRQIVLSELFYELFPDAKWIMILRDEKDTFRSEFGEPFTWEEWKKLRQKRFDIWNRSPVSSKCMVIKYEEFNHNAEKMVENIAQYLGVPLSSQKKSLCINFFKPSGKSDSDLKTINPKEI